MTANPANLVRTAIDLATGLHAGQHRKGLGLPYIAHPCDVCSRLVRWGVKDEIVLAAAMLHDTLEDCNVTPWTLRQAVGPQVVALVEALSYDGPKNNPAVKQQWLDTFADKSDDALIVKAADRCCNVEDFMLSDLDYARVYFDKARVIFATLFKRQDALNKRFRSLAGLRAVADFAGLDWRLA